MTPKQLWLLGVMVLTRATCFADGGAILLRRETKEFVITVFSSQAPLSVGVGDISVLIQSQGRLEPVLDADVSMVAEHSSTAIEARMPLSPSNKVLYAAPVTFSEPGPWDLILTIQRQGERTAITVRVDAVPAPVLAASYGKYVTFPPLMVALFLIREQLIRRKRRG
jgi:hypothetical protein